MSIEKHFAVVSTSFCQNSGSSVTVITVLTTVKCRSLGRLGWQPVALLLPFKLTVLGKL